MCHPLVFAAASLALTAYGTYKSIEGQNKSGEATQADYNYLADTTEKQIGITQQTGEVTRKGITDQAGRTSAQNESDSAAVLGSQKTASAASGIGGGSVTSENLAMDTVTKTHMNEMFIRNQADIAKWQNQNQENMEVYNLQEKAKAYRRGIDASKMATEYGTTGTLISGAGQMANTWYNYTRSGKS
jgi:hypothetical protein